MHVPDGTVWTGPLPDRPGLPAARGGRPGPRAGWTSVDFEIEHAYGESIGIGQGVSPRRSSRVGLIASSDRG